MRVIVTGASGFVGRAVVAALRDRHEVVATDLAPAPGVAGDLTDPAFLARLFATRCDAVIHLAALPGGACEADPARGWRINVAATQAVASGAARYGARFVYASSIAVHGDPAAHARITDDTPPAPRMLYGAHKLMMEAWLATLARRGALTALSLRLPGIVARPDAGAGLGSAFLSALFRHRPGAPPLRLPVSPDAHSWLMSAPIAARNLVHALAVPADALPDMRAVTLPALRVRIGDVVAARGIAVDPAPDPAVEAQFGAYPPLDTPAARALGFVDDGALDALIARAAEPAR